MEKKLLTNVTVEGVVITPEIHSELMMIQGFPTCLVSVTEDTINHLLNDRDENTAEQTLDVLKSLYSLQKSLKRLIPPVEGGEQCDA